MPRNLRNPTLEHVLPVAERVCAYFLEQSQGYNGEYMCPGIIQSYGPVVRGLEREGGRDRDRER